MIWASRAPDFVLPLEKLLERPELVDQTSAKSELRAFEIVLTAPGARRFAGRRTVIEEIELLAPTYYERIGQFLNAWVPPPPKPKHSVAEPETTLDAVPVTEIRPQAGNAHAELLDMPSFLIRPAVTEPSMPSDSKADVEE